MFSPQKLLAIITLMLIAVTMSVQDTSAQGTSQYEARLQAMQNARARARQTAPRPNEQTPSTVRQTTYDEGFEYVDPPAPPSDSATRLARSPRQSTNRVARRQAATRVNGPRINGPRTNGPRTVRRSGVAATQYQPSHLRTAQLYETQIIDEGAPIISGASIDSGVTFDAGIGCTSCGGSGCSACGDVYNDVVYSDVGCGGCGSCGSCDDRGGCPPGTWENCWLGKFGLILENGDYFLGSSAFKGPGFSVPGLDDQFNDSNFGFYGGVNFGVPLCKLTCGVLSAQLGARSVQTNFNGDTFTPENRDQTFVTAGLYRRVDYGIQAGVVYDLMRDEWFTNSEVGQVRIDVAWVYPNGSTFGFRSATNNSDDISSGVINGVNFNGLTTSTLDQYRFYGRRAGQCGGYSELFAGWADDSRTVVGIDFDLPIRGRLALQSGVTYIIADDVSGVGGTDADMWNLYMGIHFRPRGLSWYRYYDRPLFNVADNGSMILTR